MIPKILRIKLKSASTFGRGDGVPGLADADIEHDSNGFPFLRGRTLKGLLAESAENVVYALSLQNKGEWKAVKKVLFGSPGKGLSEQGMLRVGDARIPQTIRRMLETEILSENITPEDVLFSLTGVRHQTSMNPDGAPDYGSLRAMRVLLKGVVLESELNFEKTPSPECLQLLTAAAMDFRRAGTARNRGRGWLIAEWDTDNATQELFNQFTQAVNP